MVFLCVLSSVILWYLWTNGENKLPDGFSWTAQDAGPEGVGESPAGAEKVGKRLLQFFKNGPYSKRWFVSGMATK